MSEPAMDLRIVRQQREYTAVPMSTLAQWAAEGRLEADDLVRPVGGSNWLAIAHVNEFAGHVPKAATAAAAPQAQHAQPQYQPQQRAQPVAAQPQQPAQPVQPQPIPSATMRANPAQTVPAQPVPAQTGPAQQAQQQAQRKQAQRNLAPLSVVPRNRSRRVRFQPGKPRVPSPSSKAAPCRGTTSKKKRT